MLMPSRWKKTNVAKKHHSAFGHVTTQAAAYLSDCVDAKSHFSANGVSVLEFGAGTGSLAQETLQRFPEIKQYLAADISPEMLEIFRAELGGGRSNRRT